MKKIDSQSKVDEVISTLDNTLTELRQGFKPEKLTGRERERILSDLDKLEVEAFKCKVKLEVKSYVEADPDISYKETLEKVLQILPSKIAPGAINELAEYTAKVWSEMGQLA